jgi:Glyoxalase-like domain
MPVEVDHVFICTAAGAPAASRLQEFGLTEGSPNRHAGQGTACRRFFFQNAMLELIWLEDAAEAQSEGTSRTRLLERCSAAGLGASPFGIILRPESESPTACPFESWEYRPKAMPDLALQIAADTGLEEPMWCYMKGGRAPAQALPERHQPLEHPAGFREITGVHIVCPALRESSVTRAMSEQKVITLETGAEHLLVLQFDGGQKGSQADFRPDLPLVFQWWVRRGL